jgi:hypothetical protein
MLHLRDRVPLVCLNSNNENYEGNENYDGVESREGNENYDGNAKGPQEGDRWPSDLTNLQRIVAVYPKYCSAEVHRRTTRRNAEDDKTHTTALVRLIID